MTRLVMVTLSRTPSACLRLFAGKGFVADFLAVKALRWTLPGGEHRRVGRLSSQAKVLTVYESSCLAALRHVDNHRTVDSRGEMPNREVQPQKRKWILHLRLVLADREASMVASTI